MKIIKRLRNSAAGQFAKKLQDKVEEYSQWNIKVEQAKAEFGQIKKDSDEAVFITNEARKELYKLQEDIRLAADTFQQQKEAHKVELDSLFDQIRMTREERVSFSEAWLRAKKDLDQQLSDSHKDLEALLEQVSDTSKMVLDLSKQKDNLDKSIVEARKVESDLLVRNSELGISVKALEGREETMNAREKHLLKWEAELTVKADDLNILEKRLKKWSEEDFGATIRLKKG